MASLYTIIAIALLSIFALLTPVFLHKKKEVLNTDKFKAKYGSLIIKMNPKKHGIFYYQTFFVLRRLLLAIMIVCASS